MEIIQKTLYILTQHAYLHRDHLTVRVEVDGVTRLNLPIHNIDAIALFGNIMVSPGVLALCAEEGIPITFLRESGRLLARVDAPVSGNVLLRREQFRKADQQEAALKISKSIVAGKLQNERILLQRFCREATEQDTKLDLQKSIDGIANIIQRLDRASDVDQVRGYEGEAARTYFGSFNAMIRQQKNDFIFQGRTRRPPRDPVNALLSYLYALLLNDCIAATVSAGLDPNVGYLHADRPGKPSLALDLMEEFRSLIADRLALTLINRKQIKAEDIIEREGGSYEIGDETRRTVIGAWQDRKQEMVTHPLLEQKARIGLLPGIQAKILARHIRGDLPEYVPCLLR